MASVGGKKTRAKKVRLETSPFPQREHAREEAPRIGGAVRPAVEKPREDFWGPLKKHSTLLVCLAVLVALAGGGSAFYQHKKKEKEFTTNFILAIYASSVGEKKAVATCDRIATDWKAKGEQNPPPPASADEQRDLNAAREEVDRLMQKIQNGRAPKDLEGSVQKLSALTGAYKKTYALAISPGGTLPSFTASAAKLDGEYQAAAKALRSGLSPEVAEKIRKASRRYRGLQGFLE